MKARFQRALALLLVLVLTLGCIPAVSAVQPNEPVTNPEPAEEAAQLPEGSDLGAILQGNKDAELEALQPETPKDTDLVRVIVELDAPALSEQSGMFAGKALTDAGRTAQQNVIAAQEQVEAKIAEAAPEASVRYSYSLPDPAWSVFGLPRIIINKENILRMMKMVDDPHDHLSGILFTDKADELLTSEQLEERKK